MVAGYLKHTQFYFKIAEGGGDFLQAIVSKGHLKTFTTITQGLGLKCDIIFMDSYATLAKYCHIHGLVVECSLCILSLGRLGFDSRSSHAKDFKNSTCHFPA